MEKINFANNDAPYLSADNLNQMQDNIEEAINGVVLWENPNPINDFGEQTINLSLSEYKIIEIEFNNSANVRIKLGGIGYAIIVADENGNWTGSWFIDCRRISTSSTGITFYDNRGMSTKATNQYFIRNNMNIPIKIIGYK